MWLLALLAVVQIAIQPCLLGRLFDALIETGGRVLRPWLEILPEDTHGP